jgi:hypothetical protein
MPLNSLGLAIMATSQPSANVARMMPTPMDKNRLLMTFLLYFIVNEAITMPFFNTLIIIRFLRDGWEFWRPIWPVPTGKERPS